MTRISDLSTILNDTCTRQMARFYEQQEEDRKACDEFRAIDLGRLMYDKEYQRKLDERFGVGWMERAKFVH